MIRLLPLLLLVAGCSALRRPPDPVDRSQDARILREVLDRLEAEPGIDAGLLRVEVDGGIVTLYGSVAGIAGWNCAVRNAQLVPGVRTVVEFMVIERSQGLRPCLARRSVETTMARIVPPSG